MCGYCGVREVAVYVDGTGICAPCLTLGTAVLTLAIRTVCNVYGEETALARLAASTGEVYEVIA